MLILHLQDTSSTQILKLTCEDQAGKLNAQLDGIRDSAQIIVEAAVADLESLRKEDIYTEYLSKMDFLMSNIAKNTNGVCACYIRFAPELTDATSGLFYRKIPDENRFEQEPVTDLLIYDPSDTEHVGW